MEILGGISIGLLFGFFAAVIMEARWGRGDMEKRLRKIRDLANYTEDP